MSRYDPSTWDGEENMLILANTFHQTPGREHEPKTLLETYMRLASIPFMKINSSSDDSREVLFLVFDPFGKYLSDLMSNAADDFLLITRDQFWELMDRLGEDYVEDNQG